MYYLALLVIPLTGLLTFLYLSCKGKIHRLWTYADKVSFSTLCHSLSKLCEVYGDINKETLFMGRQVYLLTEKITIRIIHCILNERPNLTLGYGRSYMVIESPFQHSLFEYGKCETNKDTLKF